MEDVDSVVMGPDMDYIFQAYGSMADYHLALSDSLHALAGLLDYEMDEAQQQIYDYAIHNHIMVLGGLLTLSLKEAEKATVLKVLQDLKEDKDE